MSSILALAGIVALCALAGWFFGPRYGAPRGCTGRALGTAMEEEKGKRAACDRVDDHADGDTSNRQ